MTPAAPSLRVAAIWRYPVKAMLGQSLSSVSVGSAGCAGDRRWLVVDVASGERIANKRGATDPRLRACRAELIAGADPERAPRITMPGGATAEGGEVDEALSLLLERPVALRRARDAGQRGRYGSTGAHHDFAPIHLIATSTLEHLRQMAPDGDWGALRFRPNLLLDDRALDRHGPVVGPRGGPAESLPEDALPGNLLRAGSGLELDCGLPTPRCVVPTRAQDGLPAHPSLLRTLVERRRFDLGPFGRQGCAGTYAEVRSDGEIAVGDRLRARAARSPAQAISAALGGLPA